MKPYTFSVKKLFGWICIGLLLSMTGITLILFVATLEITVLIVGALLIACALVWFFVLTQAFGKQLSQFTFELCKTLDNMIDGAEEPSQTVNSETLFARINHRLSRLYQIMQENRRKVDEERQELQTLVSDISHQVKTPVSNLKMATDTLLTRPVTETERIDFIKGVRSQTDKLEFLFQALVKTSRLETGVIRLEKKPECIYNTVAQAMSGIVYAAEKKQINVSIHCPENLTVAHDSKWTAEALFNLLDNAVKYTPVGGKITVIVEEWEMYVEIKVIDTGKGISESNQAAIFRRFYREEEVHEQPGVGIGLYLAREIVHEALFVALSPHELYERKVTMQELHAAISRLPNKQAKRIYAHFILGMSVTDIARAEGVAKSRVSDSIRRGLRNMEKILRNKL